MSTGAALLVAVGFGIAWGCALLALVPTEHMGVEGDKNAGLCCISGAAVVLGLAVLLVNL